ncbi:uncharacterized protein HD556DRAFT_419811 [Suillus plorans]|uniref:DUF6533 domain-containing protein n=1 Tax=Suillus plorans TaxID=116603 RepID=A0A9P7AR48_9AGAM|nr:uncharacterized protein HD556DRAFT_419811 [Suillus plorans]KAG1794637.1 hypothetical protein HD556DRAFT_419811 [Suillus plorans]
MTNASNDPSLWPLIYSYRIISYVVVAASTAVVYNWTLTIRQEVELIWRQRWSLMTVLYLTLRSAGILFCVLSILSTNQSISLTDKVSTILAFTQAWTSFVVYIMLGVIVIARLHAMYHSRKMLIFLVIVFMVVTIACGLVIGIVGMNFQYGETVLSGTYQCIGEGSQYSGRLLVAVPWVFYTTWGIIGLSLAVWVAFRHFREMKRWAIEDRRTALIKMHVIYFTIFSAAACLNLGSLSPRVSVRRTSCIDTDYLLFFTELGFCGS